MKTKSDRKVNASIKKLNRQLKEDVFEDRFEIKQISKSGTSWDRGYHWYNFIFIDNSNPKRNFIYPLDEGEVLILHQHYTMMNRFIVESDFWKKYHSNDKKF